MLAFVFPGQGSQTVGMGRDIIDRWPTARRTLEEADDAIGFSLSNLIKAGPAEELQLTANSQPAILAMSIAILRVIQEETGLRPDVVAGHSLGEFTSLVCAGALPFEDAVPLVHKRGIFMQQAVPVGEGAMAAVMGIDEKNVAKLVQEASQSQTLVMANYNSSKQIVISGDSQAIDRAVAVGDQYGAVVRKLKVSAPFHSPLMEPAAEQLEREIAKLSFADPEVAVIHNCDAQPNQQGSSIPGKLVAQVTSTVLWEQSVQQMTAMGVKEIFEIGPGKVLTNLVRRIDKNLTVSAVNEPEHIDEIMDRAQKDLQKHVALSGEWRQANDGSKISEDGKHIIWADGSREQVTSERWYFNDNGSKIRKYGGMKIIWPDGRLEVLSPDEWLPRRDGSFARKDHTAIISYTGELERFDLDEWDISEHGTMKSKDGTRIIWPDGMEWNQAT